MTPRIHCRTALLFAAFLLSLASISLHAQLRQQPPPPQTGPFSTPLAANLIDGNASAEWVDNAERPLANPAALRQVFWTQTAATTGNFLAYGAGGQPGLRHLRVGFTAPVAIGSILTRGGDRVSVLRSDAKYPGNLADDSQWIPAQNALPQPSGEVDRNSYGLWILPEGTRTRAIRFTHDAQPTDKTYNGTVGGVYLLSSRITDLAPQASILPSANPAAAPLLADAKENGGRGWDNGPEYRHAVTPQTPEWITLAWPQPVSLSGLGFLWAGFNAADAQVFTGPSSMNPQGAADSNWKPVGQPVELRNQYLRPLAIDWLDFGKTVQTRAVRVRMTAVIDEKIHPHLVGTTRNGNRVWLGEILALSPLGSADFKPSLSASPAAMAMAMPSMKALAMNPNLPHPPIPVHFNLDTPGYVSLVIEDAQGNRVRNLISDTWFEAGPNTAWWDGSDDLGRNPDAANHGVYLIPTHFVSPGHYTVRGLVHKQIDLRYEFPVYTNGNPAWETADGKGGWLANHTPPSSALFVPADKAPGGKPLVYLGSYVTEGLSALAWVDLDGVKQGGRGWIGGSWTGAPYLTRDLGQSADPDAFAYTGAAWHEDVSKTDKTQTGVIRITGLTAHGDKQALNLRYEVGDTIEPNLFGKPIWTSQMSGLAIRNGLAVVSLPRQNHLLFADIRSGKGLGLASIESPQGLAFDGQGRLLVLSGKRLLRYALPADLTQLQPQQLPQPTVLIAEGLEQPAGLTQDNAGNFYISDRGSSNQVKVFSTSGKLLRTIGHPGAPQAGLYDAQHMNNPRGLTIDSSNRIWVAEEDFYPKRVSVWTLDGSFVKAFYGPSEYGGGGALDPQDKSLFYYHGMEFKLDWKAGTDALHSVLYRPNDAELPLPIFSAPTTVVYAKGHRYFTNTYIGHGTNGNSIAMLYLDTGGVIRPAAAFGRAFDWNLLATPPFKSLWPANPQPSAAPDVNVLFTWSDLNNNGKVDPDEVTFLRTSTGAITVMPDLSLIDAYVEGNAVSYAPARILPSGVPVFNLHGGKVVVAGAQKPAADGGGQVIVSPQAAILTTAPTPFVREGLGGVYKDSANQEHRWSYPSLWPGLHPSHNAPTPDRPGELVGTTRLLGGFVTPPGSDAGPLWSINGNFGEMYLFTADGLFVTQMFQNVRIGKPWSSPIAQRNMLLNDLSPASENFFPSINQTPDGNVYLVDGIRTSIVRVDNLNTIRRIAPFSLDLTATDLKKAQDSIKQGELTRQQTAGPQTLQINIRSGAAPSLKDLVNTLSADSWATIDQRITQIGWSRSPNQTEAAVTIAGGRLYAAFRTGDPKLLTNSGAVANAPFKTGGALDLMLGTNSNADPKRESAVAGDIRLLVYQVDGATKALLYRAVVPGTANPVPFSSPDRTITLDQVQDVTNALQFDSSSSAGTYAFSIPLATLGLKAVAGQRIKADIGVLRGSSGQTQQRVYWNNKATGITSDVPSEAELTPNLWGDWVFKSAP